MSLLLSLVIGLAVQDANAEKLIGQAVDDHWKQYDAKQRTEIKAEFLALWKKLPEGETKNEGLGRIVRHVEQSGFLVSRANLDLVTPDRFMIRAHDLTRRYVASICASATRFPARTQEDRAAILKQLDELFNAANKAFLDKVAGDPIVEGAVLQYLGNVKVEFRDLALDSPFVGWMKPLAPEAVAAVKAKFVEKAKALPKIESRLGQDGKPVVVGLTLHEALKVIYEISRAQSPERFAIQDQERDLRTEVKKWGDEERKNHEHH